METTLSIHELRKPKIFGMAIFDWTTSLLGAFLIGKFLLKLHKPIEWILWIFFWILFGAAVHLYFGIKTMFGYYLGLNNKPT